MAEINIPQQPLTQENTATQEVSGDQNFKRVSAGAGDEKFEVNQDGMFMGADNYADAPFKVSYAGNLTANSGTFGGTLSAAGGTLGTITSGTINGAVINTDEIYDQTYGFPGVFVKAIKTSGTGSNQYINIGTDNGGLLNVAVNYTTNSDTQYKLLPSFNVANGNSYYRVESNSGTYQIYLEKSDIADDISGINYFYITALFNSNETADGF